MTCAYIHTFLIRVLIFCYECKQKTYLFYWKFRFLLTNIWIVRHILVTFAVIYVEKNKIKIFMFAVVFYFNVIINLMALLTLSFFVFVSLGISDRMPLGQLDIQLIMLSGMYSLFLLLLLVATFIFIFYF